MNIDIEKWFRILATLGIMGAGGIGLDSKFGVERLGESVDQKIHDRVLILETKMEAVKEQLIVDRDDMEIDLLQAILELENRRHE